MVQSEIIAEIEARARIAGKPMHLLCAEADIAPSTFYRWKDGAEAKLVSLGKLMKRLGELEA